MRDRQLLYFGGAAAAVIGLGVLCSFCLLCAGLVLLLDTPAPQPEPEVARLEPWRPASSAPPAQPAPPVNSEGEVADDFDEPLSVDPDSNAAEAAAPLDQPDETTPSVMPLEGNINLYRAPSADSQIFGVLPFGQRLEVIGRNDTSTWWQVTGPGGIAWVEALLVTATNVENVPVVEGEAAAPAPEGEAAPPAEEGIVPNEGEEAPPTGGAIPVSLIEITSPVSAGSQATVTVETAPNASCTIEVTLANGPSQAPGLAPTTAGAADGICSWTWDVTPEEATPGDWPIRIIVELDGQQNVLSTGFSVQ